MAYTEEDYARARMLSPEYAKKWGAVRDARDLTTASRGVEEFLKNREIQRQETFRNSPSNVPIPMRAPEYQAPSGLEQFNERIRAMMQSGNAELQKRAGALQQRGYKAPEVKNLQTILTGVAGDPRGRQQNVLNPDGSVTPIGEAYSSQPQFVMGDGKKGQPLADADYPKYGLSKSRDGTHVYTDTGPKPVNPAAAKTTAQANKASNILDEFEYMLFDPEVGITNDYSEDNSWFEKAKQMGVANYERYMKSDPRYANYSDYKEGVGTQLLRSMGEVGATSDVDIERLEYLFPSVTGYKIDTKEVARAKLDKLKRLVKSSMVRGSLTNETLDLFNVPSLEEIRAERGQAVNSPAKVEAEAPEIPAGYTPYVPGGK